MTKHRRSFRCARGVAAAVLCGSAALTSNMRVATMTAMMLIHTAPQPRKKISPRRLDALDEKYDVEGEEAEPEEAEPEAEAAEAPELPVALVPAPAAPFLRVSVSAMALVRSAVSCARVPLSLLCLQNGVSRCCHACTSSTEIESRRAAAASSAQQQLTVGRQLTTQHNTQQTTTVHTTC